MTERKIALSIEEAADYTGIGRNTLRKLVEWKKLPVLKVGDVYKRQDPSEWVIVEHTHEPLVDKETFEKAQERVNEISDAYFAKEFTKHPPNEKNLLKGKIVCGCLLYTSIK